MSLLEIDSVSKHFGGLKALEDVSFGVDKGEVLGLIGPNGSGKTTVMNVICGVYRPESGDVSLEGSSVLGLRPYERVQHGLSRTFQSARVFDTVTVAQNMMVPLLHHHGDRAAARRRSSDLLDLVTLSSDANRAASELSGGQQRLLEFARAMMTQPKVVLMDEPFAGVHPEIKSVLISSVQEMRQAGTTFVIVSHEIPVITRVADRVICLAGGRVIAQGAMEDVVEAPQVIEAYLGHGRSGRGRGS